MKKVFFLFLTILLCYYSYSQNIIKGRIVDEETNEPVEDAILTSHRSKKFITKTDSAGFYSFDIGTGKEADVLISHIQYEKKQLMLKTNDNKITTLTPFSHMIDAIVVTGQHSPQSLKNSVYSVRVINEEKIQMRAANNVADVLNTELGVRFTNDLALGETKISLMGMDGQNVKILLDGIPLLDRGDSRQSLGQIDVNSIERIEIVEGPMSVIYGSDALAGVINIITKKGRGHKLSINAHIQEESVGNEYNFLTDEGVHNESLNVGWSNDHWRISAGGSRNEFGGWANGKTDRSKYWQPKTQYLGNGTLGYNKSGFNVWYRLDYAYEDLYTPAPYSTLTYNVVDRDFITNRYTHQLQADWRIKSSFIINAAASYQHYTRDSKAYNVNVQTKEENLISDIQTALFNSIYFRTTAAWTLNKWLSLQPGIDFKKDEGSGERIEGKPSITDYAAYVSAEVKPLSWMNIRPGLRFIYNTEYDAPPAVPSINTKFILNKFWDLRLGYGYGFRAPSINELYFSFHDTNHNIDGNTDLKAEYSNSFTASLAWSKKFGTHVRLASTLSGFYNDFNDKIDLAERTDISGYYKYVNIDRYKTTGGTWANSLNYKNLSFVLGFSYIGYYNEFERVELADGSSPEFTWSPEVNSTLTYNFPKLKGKVSLFYKYTGKYDKYQLDSNNQMYLSTRQAYNWLDLTLSKEIIKGLSATAGVKNILNVKTVDDTTIGTGHSSGNGSVSVAYGTSFFFGINYSFNK